MVVTQGSVRPFILSGSDDMQYYKPPVSKAIPFQREQSKGSMCGCMKIMKCAKWKHCSFYKLLSGGCGGFTAGVTLLLNATVILLLIAFGDCCSREHQLHSISVWWEIPKSVANCCKRVASRGDAKVVSGSTICIISCHFIPSCQVF